MLLRRSTTRYSETPEAATPYQRAQQQWDERIGSARVQAHNWRLMAFIAMALACVMTLGLLWQATRSTVVPYIVRVDAQGDARAVGPATGHYTPNDGEIGRDLSDFLKNVRSISLDPIVLRNNWLDAYHYVTTRGAAKLNEYARERNPFAQVGRVSVTADITSVVRASENSFQLRWTERAYANGTLTSTEYWTGIFSITLQPPKDVERIRNNPLGVYVDGFDWSRELTNDTRSGEAK